MHSLNLETLNKMIKKWVWIEILIGVLGLALSIGTLILRIQLLSVIVSSLTVIAIVFTLAMKVSPIKAYRDYLKQAAVGLRRSVAGRVKQFSEDTAVRQGCKFYELTLDVDGNERFVLVDAQQARPNLVPEQRVQLTLYGNYLVSIDDAEGETP